MQSSKIKTLLLMRDNTGPKVADLKAALRKTLGKPAAAPYPGLAKGKTFDADTETALRAWQASVGLVADGIAKTNGVRSCINTSLPLFSF